MTSRHTKEAEAAAPILTFDLTFILGYDLFVLLESARGGHSPAVPGLLSNGQVLVRWSPASLRGEAEELYSLSQRSQEAAPAGGTGGARRRRERSDQSEPGARTMLRAEPPWALASRSPSPRGRPCKLGRAGGRGASPGRFLYGRGADAGIARAPRTIVEPRAGVAPRRPPPPPFLPAPRGCDAAAAADAPQAEGMAVPTRVRSAGPEGRRRRRGSDAPRSAPRSSPMLSRRREGPPLPRSPAPRLFLRRPLDAAAPWRTRRHTHPEPRPRPLGAQTSLAARTCAAGPEGLRQGGDLLPRGWCSWDDLSSVLTLTPPLCPALSSTWRVDVPRGQPTHLEVSALGGAPSAVLPLVSVQWSRPGDPSKLRDRPSCCLRVGFG